MLSMFIKGRSRKGSMTVEAAIFLPLFIIGLLGFSYLISAMGIQESVLHSYLDEAGKTAIEAYVSDKEEHINALLEMGGGFLGDFLFETRLKNRIEGEQGSRIRDLSLNRFQYLVNNSGMSGIIHGELTYRIDIPLTVWFYDGFPVSETLVFRGFVGAEKTGDPFGFQLMELEDEAFQVWVFPRAGEKYHKDSCSVIAVCSKEAILTDAFKRRYEACSLCRPENLPSGSKVFYFPGTGTVFHKRDCYTVERYVIPMSKDEAAKQGYDACLKCGG